MNYFTVVSAVWDCIGEDTPLAVLPGLIEPAELCAADELSGSVAHVEARDPQHAVKIVKDASR
jgi:hypothetical protein